MRTIAVVVVLSLSLFGLYAWADTTVLANQGRPGTQGPWPVTIGGGSVVIVLDGGFIGYTLPQPCTGIVMTNDAGVGTSPSRVPVSGPATNRIWIRLCNSVLNSPTAVCICRTEGCPNAVAVGTTGDALATGDCVTYNLGTMDGGVPCCVCNGASTFLPAAECIP